MLFSFIHFVLSDETITAEMRHDILCKFQGGGHSHTWTWWGTSALLTPVFYIFPSLWVPFLSPTRSYWPPLSAEKISLSLAHLVPEIIWHKVGLIFHKILSFDHFEAFCTNFLLDFRSCWPPKLFKYMFYYYVNKWLLGWPPFWNSHPDLIQVTQIIDTVVWASTWVIPGEL